LNQGKIHDLNLDLSTIGNDKNFKPIYHLPRRDVKYHVKKKGLQEIFPLEKFSQAS